MVPEHMETELLYCTLQVSSWSCYGYYGFKGIVVINTVFRVLNPQCNSDMYYLHVLVLYTFMVTKFSWSSSLVIGAMGHDSLSLGMINKDSTEPKKTATQNPPASLLYDQQCGNDAPPLPSGEDKPLRGVGSGKNQHTSNRIISF